MTKAQNSFSQMLSALRLTCDAHHTVWKDNVTFSAAFNNGVVAIEAGLTTALSQQAMKTVGTTKMKQKTRAQLADKLQFMASRVALYAITAADKTLLQDAHLPPYKISAAKEDALVGMVTRITGLATMHLADLAPFGVTATDVSALSSAGAAYAALIGAPARKLSASKEATKTIAALITTARAQLRIMDAHRVLWRNSNPAFYAEYRTARHVSRPGYRTRALEVSVQDAKGEPVARAVFHLPSEGLMRKTSGKGLCRISHLLAGEHRAMVSADGYAEQEVPFAIGHGQKTRLSIVLQKAEL